MYEGKTMYEEKKLYNNVICDDCESKDDIKCSYICGKCNGDETFSCSNCEGTRDLICGACDGTGKSFKIFKCAVCEGKGTVSCRDLPQQIQQEKRH